MIVERTPKDRPPKWLVLLLFWLMRWDEGRERLSRAARIAMKLDLELWWRDFYLSERARGRSHQEVRRMIKESRRSAYQ